MNKMTFEEKEEAFMLERNHFEENGTMYPAAPRRRRKASLPRKLAALCLSGAVLGGAAAGGYYGVSCLLPEEDTTVHQTISASAMSLDGTSQSVGGLDVSDIAAEALPSVVSITNISVQEVKQFYRWFGHNGEWQTTQQETTSCGSGVIIAQTSTDLYIVTNYHVVEDATTLSVGFIDEAVCEAELCGYDEELDIAVIKVPVSSLSEDTLSNISIAQIGNSDELRVGNQVVAIGNALGYGQSVTTGIVSAVNRTVTTGTDAEGNPVTATYLQTDAAINPGNSGGALLNMDGELIGINTAKVSSDGVEGMGYAIPISEAWETIQSMIPQSAFAGSQLL